MDTEWAAVGSSPIQKSRFHPCSVHIEEGAPNRTKSGGILHHRSEHSEIVAVSLEDQLAAGSSLSHKSRFHPRTVVVPREEPCCAE